MKNKTIKVERICDHCIAEEQIDREGIRHVWHTPKCPFARKIEESGNLDLPICDDCRDKIQNGGTKMKQKKNMENINETENMVMWEDRDNQSVVVAFRGMTIALDYEEFEELKELVNVEYQWQRPTVKRKK